MSQIIKWVEIPATNFNRAVEFYSQILEIDLKPMDFSSEKMACLPNNEGAISLSPGFEPSNKGVLVSLNADHKIDSMIERITKAGGKIVQAKTKIEADGKGYFALFIDSEGNQLGLYGDA